MLISPEMQGKHTEAVRLGTRGLDERLCTRSYRSESSGMGKREVGPGHQK